MSIGRRLAALMGTLTLSVCAPAAFASSPAAARTAPDTGPPCTSHANAEQPVICVPRGFRQEGGFQLAPGGSMTYNAQVVNRGSAVADAMLDIELPPDSKLSRYQTIGRVNEQWWVPGSQPYPDDMKCSPGTARITCSVGTLPRNANITVVVPLTFSRSAPTGATRQMRMTLRPGSGQGFGDTAIRVPVQLVRPIHLEVSVRPTRPVVQLGVRTTIRVRIHNPGPDVARDTLVSAEDNYKRNTSSSISPRFQYPNEPDPPPADPSFYFLVPSAGYLNQVLSPDPNDGGRVDEDTQTLTFWRAPAIAAGATATVPIVVEATSAGTTKLRVEALSSAGEPYCPRRLPRCHSNEMTVTALVIKDGALADTGADARAVILLAALALVAGGAMHLSARRRPGAGVRQTSGSTR